MDYAEMLRQQRAFLAEAGLDISGLGTTPEAEIYANAPPADAELATPEKRITPAAGLIAVEATFRAETVAIDQKTTPPYSREVAYVSDSALPSLRGVSEADLALARRNLTLAVLAEPEREFTISDLAGITESLDINASWDHLGGLVRNWWNHKLTIRARPLVVTGKIGKRRANPLLKITVHDEPAEPKTANE
ncbi:MAG TPA: hypothetical protein VLF62_03920 [Candidatus Saccharimonadales bacterium]|jgi:hypothetical protein|nr:hypothetical protein [Candidatus Saccharimonadales bacterium]